MSRSDNKKKVFTTIGAYTSLNEQGKMPNTTSIYPSVNNKKETIPFMLDVLGVVVGTEALKLLIGELLTKLVDQIEPKIKKSLKKQVSTSNSNEPQKPGWVVEQSIPSLNAKDCVSPDNSNLLLDDNKDDLNKALSKSVKAPGAVITYPSVPGSEMITVEYKHSTDKVVIKPHPNMAGKSIGVFLLSLVESMVIINKKALVTNVTNAIYGTLSYQNKKTREEIKTELTANKLIEQYVDEGNDTFELIPKYVDEIEKKADEIASGIVYYDMGCGLMPVSLNIDDLTSLVTSVSGSTDSFFISNAFDETITKSSVGLSPETTKENKQTIRDNFFKRLIKELTNALVQSITLAPQIRALLAISSMFQGGISKITNPKDDLKKFKHFIKCNANEMMKIIGEFIFKLLTTALIALLKPIIKKIAKEKSKQYAATLKSLTPAPA